MEKLFIGVLNLGISAGYFILAVILLRLFLKKVPKNIICVLWLLVGIRLLIPFSIESVVGLVPGNAIVDENIMYQERPMIHSGVDAVDRNMNQYLQRFEPDYTASVNPMQIILMVFTGIWVVGMLLMAGYFLFSWWSVGHRVKGATPLITEDGTIYESETIDTPFLLGVIHPRIYVPTELPQDERVFVIAHEKAHILRRDYLIKPLAFLILLVYWFHPLVWVSYILLCRDIELACDERVIKSLGMDCKKEYSQALLNCSVNRKMIAACPVAFGEVSVKERVKNILNYKKPGFWVVLAAVILCVITSVCFLTQKKDEEATVSEETGAAEPDTVEISSETGVQEKVEEATIFHVTLPEELENQITRRIEEYKTLVFLDGAGENELGTMKALPMAEAMQLSSDSYALIGNYGANALLSDNQTNHSYSQSGESETTYYYYEEAAPGEQEITSDKESSYGELPNAQGTYDLIKLSSEKGKNTSIEQIEQNATTLPNETITTKVIPSDYCYLFVYGDETLWQTEKQADLEKLQQEIVSILEQVEVEELVYNDFQLEDEAINQYAQAFCDRDGRTLIPMLSDKVTVQMEKMDLMTIGEDYFGWSSPWPMWLEKPYKIENINMHVNNQDDAIEFYEKQATILYYAAVSDPHVTVWQETIGYTMENNRFQIVDEDLEFLDTIATAEEFYRAYPDGKITGTPMDYNTNEMGDALAQNARENPDSEWYSMLFSPDTAAIYLLNIVNDENKVQISVDSSADGIAQISILFLEDNSSVGVTMIQLDGADGIWLPQDNRATLE